MNAASSFRPSCTDQSFGFRGIIVVFLSLLLVSGCSSFKKNKVDENASAEELYAAAQTSMRKKNWATAINQLRNLEAKYPYGKYAEQAQLDTAYAYYQGDLPDLSIAAADRFIKLHPTHSSVDYAYYLKGLASFEEDDSLLGRLTGQDDLSDRDANLTRSALIAFQDVYTLFPNSQYAADAKARALYLLNALAQHEMAIANYYFSREAYVAAVNRAKGVVEQYPESPQIEDALGMLMHSYNEMGLEDLAVDSRRVLELNFPESAYLTGSTDELFKAKWYSVGKSKNKKPGVIRSFFGSIFNRSPAES
ncbi:MAG: outer membrane protein assembly factor BamD [Pseudomonadota bacterium]